MTPDQVHKLPLADETTQAPAPRRRRWLGVTLIVLAVLAAGTGVTLLINSGSSGSTPSPARLDSSDPAAVARAFATAYARHDPAACGLASTDLRQRFEQNGQCTGSATTTAPQITVLFARTCGNRTGVQMQISPPGAFGTSFAMISLGQGDPSADPSQANPSSSGSGQPSPAWSVISLVTFPSRSQMQPYQCAPSATDYGG